LPKPLGAITRSPFHSRVLTPSVQCGLNRPLQLSIFLSIVYCHYLEDCHGFWLGKRVASTQVMMTGVDKSILIVEDDKLLNWSLAKSLAKWGFAAHPVFTGSEAMAELDKSGFDVILLDYQLPDLDGLQVARFIRKSQPRAVIFLVTAFQLNELTVDSGLIDVYFNKPLDFEQLRQALVSIPKWSEDSVTVSGSQFRI
jgi:CheY-like chemotaxis protein